MREQITVSAQHQGKWVFVADDDEAERIWRDFEEARAELESEGWQVAEGPEIVRPAREESRQIEVMGNRLRRVIQ